MHDIYSEKELFSYGSQPQYPSNATETAFFLGGIGTGTISLGSRGDFRDWEIMNHPDVGNKAYYGFFSISVQKSGEKRITKALESKLNPPYTQARGYHSGTTAGLPRLNSSQLKSQYPFVQVDFEDKTLPLSISMEAFTPFIPLNADDSGIPGAVVRYKVKNLEDTAIEVSIAGSLMNLVGFSGYDCFDNLKGYSGSKNEYIDRDGMRGIYLTNTEFTEQDCNYGSLALSTKEQDISVKPTWLKGYWWDHVQDFWDDFSQDGRLEEADAALCVESANPEPPAGSLAIHKMLAPHEEACFEFYITWSFPNRPAGWFERDDGTTVKNYYSKKFHDAWSAAAYLSGESERLERESRMFSDAFFSGTIPEYVLEAVAANITTIRSNTCFRIEDGTFLAWEGCHEKTGSCEGTCTHVWNYAQTLAYLFPELERSARIVEFNLETDEDGKMAFRTNRLFDKAPKKVTPAGDGQMGTIIRLCREWKLSGDTDFLRSVWGNAKNAMEFALTNWDTDKDFVLDGTQHNTYDIAFHGIDPLVNVLFYGALKAMAEMAKAMDEPTTASHYLSIWASGNEKMDKLLWNGEYYRQQIDNVDAHRYQLGEGCLSDQLLGQTLAHLSGLGYILPEEHVKKAIYSIFSYNFRISFEEVANAQRTFALNDEKGLLLCSWPRGGRPKLPFVYSDEVWAGVEYQVAALLIYEGFIGEGLTIVKALRERYDGYKRNPYNEIECGYHYARSLASYGVFVALSGMKCNMATGVLEFNPVISPDNFSSFFSCGTAWGIYSQKKDPVSGELKKNIRVLYGMIKDKAIPDDNS